MGREYNTINFEETELRLGLPGGKGNAGDTSKNDGKRGFSETLNLKLNLSTNESEKMKEKTLQRHKWWGGPQSGPSGRTSWPSKKPVPRRRVPLPPPRRRLLRSAWMARLIYARWT
ncbi:hypothetical protein V6N12_026293 [Hibiscus sabdariffa]|uniref:Uncharacterized protein n=1 Tax=Hibiscus sabdariffa TaxID=183260 RepID=A0ABR2DRD5_9ROSI